MSQEDVLRWLGANPGWHRTATVARGIGKGYPTIYGSLRVLAKHGEIRKRSYGLNAKCGPEWSA